MKGLGASAAGVAGLSATTTPAAAIDWKDAGVTIGTAVVGGPVALGWALREFEVIGSDPPAEGLTPEVLKQQVYQTARTRKSTNASTIVDNGTILDGVKHTAYTDAKVAAIEELNAGSAESAVLDAATAAIDTYETTVRKNLLKTWNEAAREHFSNLTALDSHPDLGPADVFDANPLNATGFDAWNQKQTDVNLPDGSTFTVERIYQEWFNGSTEWDPTSKNESPNGDDVSPPARVVVYSPESVEYMDYSDWSTIWNEMDTTFQNVRDGISTWVTNVYGDVQSGDIEIGDLVTPRERASMMADGEGTSQAIADLIALNVPVDPEREATITINDTGATLSGTFALTDSSDGPLEAGTTYDTANLSGDVYFTADMSLVEGDWSAYETGVDGGNITLTSEPYDGTAVELETAADETVTVDAGNWTATGNGTWYHDASADLETDITEVASARYISTATETQYETLQLDGSFTVNKLVNTQSGEEVSTTSFSNTEPQTDSNYITQEEWKQLEEQNQKLIEKYEQSQSGGGIDLGQFDMFGIPGEVVAVGAAALVALGILGN